MTTSEMDQERSEAFAEKALEMLDEAGFGKVQVKQLPTTSKNSYYIAMTG